MRGLARAVMRLWGRMIMPVLQGPVRPDAGIFLTLVIVAASSLAIRSYAAHLAMALRPLPLMV